MHLETKFLRLRTPVMLGSRFGDWQVTWLGGWSRYRLYYLVMVVKLPTLRTRPAPRPLDANVGTHRERHGGRAQPGAAPDDREKPERRDEFTEKLCIPASGVARSEKQRLAEHQVSRRNTGERSEDLSRNIKRHCGPG